MQKTRLKYLSQLSKTEIFELISPALEDGVFSDCKIVEDENEEVLVVSMKNRNFGELSTTHYILNDYQLLSIASKHNQTQDLRFNLPVERLINQKHRNKNKRFLSSMIRRFKNTNYSTDATSYYNSFSEAFEKLNHENKKLIKKVQYGKFKGDFKKAVEEIHKFPFTYGFKDYYSVEEYTNRTINHIMKVTQEINQEDTTESE